MKGISIDGWKRFVELKTHLASVRGEGSVTMSDLCCKCGQPPPFDIRYHVGSYDDTASGIPGQRCAFPDINPQDGEHLHIYCKCGYDWCTDVRDKYKPILDEPADDVVYPEKLEDE
jgi:hypothetical protein